MKVLINGDAAVATGFAKCTHAAGDALVAAGHEVRVVGINYDGDPHKHPYEIFPAMRANRGEDAFGARRTAAIAYEWQPDVVLLVNDPWNVPLYMKHMHALELRIPVVAWLAVDGKNIDGTACNELALAVFWTRFGENEARVGGCTAPTAIVPLGVDLETFKPRSQADARARFGLPAEGFLIGNVSRNGPRKRLDLVAAYVAQWARERDDVYLMMHVAPTGERTGYDVKSIAHYHGLRKGHLLLSRPENVGHGVTESELALAYNAMDVYLTCAQGEGWDLPAMEAMASGIVVIAPDWAAHGEWPEDAILRARCSSIAHTHSIGGGVGVVGGVADRDDVLRCLDQAYASRDERERLGRVARALVERPHFRWPAIGAEMTRLLEGVVAQRVKEAA